ncbi:MAG: rod shape-determining protein MreD [Chloroflexi bacterium]|nr:MAG: rod shape-determining protein MreD [Chloroflexota bacterium]
MTFHVWRRDINLYLSLPLLTGIALIQSILFSRVSVRGARPDLMLLVVLIWAFVRSMDEGVIWGFIGGLIIDLLSGGPLGATAIALVLAAFWAGQPWGQGLGTNVARLLLLALLSTATYHLVILIILAWTGHTIDWEFALLRVAGPSVLLNTILTPFIRQPLAWLSRRIRREGLNL